MPTPSQQSGTPRSVQMIDPAALMRIKSLELRARTVVEGFWHGTHRSPFHGFSAEFTEYRAYTPGDDLRYLDWGVYARSDRFCIKKFEDETNLRCYLLVDQSKSMSYGSMADESDEPDAGGYSKTQYANTLAATLAYFLNQQGDAVGLMTFDDAITDYLPAKSRARHLKQIMLSLGKPSHGRATDVGLPLRRIAELVRRRAMIVLVSDLLTPIDSLSQQLSYLRACGHEVAVFQTLDPAEMSFAFDDAAVYRDLETEQDWFVDPEAIKDSYQSKLNAHLASIESICAGLGMMYQQVQTDQPLEAALFDFLQSRMRRGRLTRVASSGSHAGSAVGGSS